MTTFSLPDGTVIPEDARGVLRLARASKQEVLLRLPERVMGSGCVNCSGLGTLWFAVLLTNGNNDPAGYPGRPKLFDNGLWYEYKSEVFPCPVCAESQPDRIERLWAGSGLQPTERAWRVDYLDGQVGKEEAVAAAYAILTDVPRPTGWVSFFGSYGVGKSGVLKSLVCACIRAGVAARYVLAAEILTEARGTYDDQGRENEQALLDRYNRYQFLAVDEVTRVSGTDWAQGMLFQVLNARYDRRNSVATAIATNAAPGDMQDTLGYLESRMKDGVRIVIGGQDMRGAVDRPLEMAP